EVDRGRPQERVAPLGHGLRHRRRTGDAAHGDGRARTARGVTGGIEVDEAHPGPGPVGAGIACCREGGRDTRILARVEGEGPTPDGAHAGTARANVEAGSCVAVVARRRVAWVLAADGRRRAEVGGADVAVVAVAHPAEAGAGRAGVAHGAGVAVGACDPVVQADEAADAGAVAGVVGANARGGARGPRPVGGAVRRAATARAPGAAGAPHAPPAEAHATH